jgi:DHA1 family inner membrane transport protein
VIGREPGLAALGWAAALLTVAGLALALVSRGLERRSAAQAPCTTAAA